MGTRKLNRKSKKSNKGFRQNCAKRQRGGNTDDDMALIEASSSGYPDIVKILLDNGADVNAKNNDNSTALMEVINCHKDIDMPWYKVEHNIIKIVKILLDNGADVNAKNSNNETALQIANKTDCTDKIKDLLKTKIRLDAAYQLALKRVPYGLRTEISKYVAGRKRKTRKVAKQKGVGGIIKI